MKIQLRALLSAVLTIALVALAAGCGSSSSDSASTSTSSAAGNPVDRAFVAAMIPHHRSAVAMAAVARQEATSPFVKTLARDITVSQTAEIALMRRVDAQLAGAGVKPGDLGMDAHAMGMDMGAASLKGAMPFDAAFMRAMVPHHQGAIAMAKVELAKGQNARLKRLAAAIIAAQQREVGAMQEHMGAGATMDSMHSGH